MECGSLAAAFTTPNFVYGTSHHLRNARRLQPLPLQRLPGVVAAQILPDAAQPPEHVHLPVRKMLEKTVADQTHHVLPVVIAFVSDFFLQHGPDGNYSGECVT